MSRAVLVGLAFGLAFCTYTFTYASAAPDYNYGGVRDGKWGSHSNGGSGQYDHYGSGRRHGYGHSNGYRRNIYNHNYGTEDRNNRRYSQYANRWPYRGFSQGWNGRHRVSYSNIGNSRQGYSDSYGYNGGRSGNQYNRGGEPNYNSRNVSSQGGSNIYGYTTPRYGRWATENRTQGLPSRRNYALDRSDNTAFIQRPLNYFNQSNRSPISINSGKPNSSCNCSYNWNRSSTQSAIIPQASTISPVQNMTELTKSRSTSTNLSRSDQRTGNTERTTLVGARTTFNYGIQPTNNNRRYLGDHGYGNRFGNRWGANGGSGANQNTDSTKGYRYSYSNYNTNNRGWRNGGYGNNYYRTGGYDRQSSPSNGVNYRYSGHGNNGYNSNSRYNYGDNSRYRGHDNDGYNSNSGNGNGRYNSNSSHSNGGYNSDHNNDGYNSNTQHSSIGRYGRGSENYSRRSSLDNIKSDTQDGASSVVSQKMNCTYNGNHVILCSSK